MFKIHNRSAFSQAVALFAVTLLLPSLAQAHTGVGQTTGFWHGAEHPLSGLDHILAMVAVGLWAAQMRGRALWAVPVTFVTVMAVGGVLGMADIAVPFVEQGIIISVLTLGVLIAASARLPLVASICIVGLFAIFHGHAHGAEMPETASGLSYGVGFVLATAFLHLCGIALGFLMQKSLKAKAVRFAGAAIALSSVYLWFA